MALESKLDMAEAIISHIENISLEFLKTEKHKEQKLEQNNRISEDYKTTTKHVMCM